MSEEEENDRKKIPLIFIISHYTKDCIISFTFFSPWRQNKKVKKAKKKQISNRPIEASG